MWFCFLMKLAEVTPLYKKGENDTKNITGQ